MKFEDKAINKSFVKKVIERNIHPMMNKKLKKILKELGIEK